MSFGGRVRRLAVLILGIPLLGVPPATAAPLPAECVASSGTVTCTYEFVYVGSPKTFTVPAGVSRITVDLYGAAGASSRDAEDLAVGGKGAHVNAVLPVTEGDSYDVYVGGRGDSNGDGGFNGGADGAGDKQSVEGGGGGGASDLRAQGGGLAGRLFVAGGGGGAAGHSHSSSPVTIPGGDGGDSGAPGEQGQQGPGAPAGGEGGGSGTQAAGGVGGITSASIVDNQPVEIKTDGAAGSLGIGGRGGQGVDLLGPIDGGGGGGGGGYYGGGGGGGVAVSDAAVLIGRVSGGGGGGGGSSYVTPLATSSSVTDGARSGDGRVVITYVDPEAPPRTAQTITFDPATTGTVGGSQTLTATTTSNLTVSFSIDSSSGPGVCSLAGDGITLNYLAAGPCVVNADQAGDATYAPAPRVTKSITVSPAKQSQTITFENPGTQAFGTSPTLTATATSGLQVRFTSASGHVCLVTSEGALTFVTTGSCTIVAAQAGNDEYEAAPPVLQSFDVGAVAPAAPTSGTATAGDASASVAFTPPANTGGADVIDYTVTASPGGHTGTCTSSPCTVGSLTNGTSYTFTVTARTSAGIGPASAPSNSVTPKGQQVITFNVPTTGAVLGSQTLSASASSGLAVSFSLDPSSGSGVCELNGSTLTYLKVGTCVVNADQAGAAAFHAAPRVTRSIDVSLVVFNPGPTATITGTPRIGATLTANAGSPKPAPTIVGYRWFANGQQLTPVTKTLKLTKAHHGKRIQVRVYAIKPGYVTATSLSPATAGVSSLQAKTLSMELSTYTARRGQRVSAEIEKLAAGEPWSIVLDGRKLVSGKANAKGVAVTSFVVPSNAILGKRTLRAYGIFADRVDPDTFTVR